MTTRTIAYLRVSTDKQADKGLSLDAQREKVEAYAKLYDLELVDTVIDPGASAKTLDRPGLNRVLSLLESGKADALLVVKLDRLTRSVRDLGHLVERYFNKHALLSVSEQIDTRSAAGRLVLNVLASVSQWEREAIGERTSTAMRYKQDRGEYIGGAAPYGYQNRNGKLVVDPKEHQAVKLAVVLRKRGLSFRAIATKLDKQGHRTRNGKRFEAMQVSRMLKQQAPAVDEAVAA